MAEQADDIVDVICTKCESLIITLHNRWQHVTKSHVTYQPKDNTQDDTHNQGATLTLEGLPGLVVGTEDFDGSGELSDCLLKILKCHNCDRLLGVKCVRAPDKKAHHRLV